MIYYCKIEDSGHMLYASEIAVNFKILSANLTPHTNLVSNIIQDYTKDLAEYRQLYYSATRGMAKVYPKNIYENAIKKFVLNNKIESHTTNKITINNKTYSFVCSVDYIKNKLKIN